MNREQSMVREFHKRFDLKEQESPRQPDRATVQLRIALIEEELKELRTALESSDLVKVADALADINCVFYGTAVSFGIDLEPVFAEVHRSNMSKGDPEVGRAANGKILKGKNWKPPVLKPILDSMSSSGEKQEQNNGGARVTPWT
jgi:predicted HAD superfamily Cof-like phosphohydrolase